MSSADRVGWAQAESEPQKHGVDFKGAKKVFDGYTVTITDDRLEYGEEPFITFGLLDGEVVTVAHTESEDLIRIISMRKATRNEEEQYVTKLSEI